MLSLRPKLLTVLLLLAGITASGALLAQMETGERGILPIDSSGTLEIGGIHVDVGGKDAQSARYAGWRIAQREGFKALWAKMQHRPISEAPNLSDSVLDGLVSSIIVEREQIGTARYIADLGILFDQAKAGQLLGVAGQVRRSAPMLLIPILITAGMETSVELRNPWQRAWAQFRTSSSAIDYVRVSGLGIDPLLINAAQTQRPGRAAWRNIVDLYGADDVLIAEVQLHRLYPGGPAIAQFIGRQGPDGRLLGSFELRARDSASLPAMMNEGVQRMDALFTQALAAGWLTPDPTLITIPPPPPVEEVEVKPIETAAAYAYSVQVVANDSASLGAAVAQIRSVDGVDSVNERSIAIGGTSLLSVTYHGDISSLRLALMARGWSVDYVGGVLQMTRSSAPSSAPPPVSPPVPSQ
jgi:hypothetical protein